MQEYILEQQIRTMVEHAAPNQLDSILSSCNKPNNTPDASICQTLAQRKEVVGISEKKKAKMRKPFGLAAIAAMAAVCILCFGGYHMFGGTTATAAADCIIMLDVNPSLSLHVDNQENVLSVEALNDDAKEVLGDMDLRGASLEVAVNAIIGSMLQKGYLGDLQNTILVSVENQDVAYGEELQEKVSQLISEAMQTDSMDAAILSQTISADDAALVELANEYNISIGKAALIQEVIAQVPTLTFEDLSPMTINEIALIAASKNVSSDSVTQTGTASSKAYISQEEALCLACAHAGVAVEDIIKMAVEFDSDHGVMIYEVEFETAVTKCEYEIDASTGEIIKSELKDSSSSVDVSECIGTAAAKEAALTHAGIAAEDVLEIEVELDSEDHVMIYKVEFETGSAKYQYSINANTGEVLSFESKTQGSATVENTSNSNSVTASDNVSSGDSTGTTSDHTAYIGDAAAKAAALAHAGVSESSTVYLKCYYKYDSGRPQYYCVEFATTSAKYVYTLDLYSGDVLWSHTYPYHSH